jgi:hypothetical protein
MSWLKAQWADPVKRMAMIALAVVVFFAVMSNL